MRRSHLTAASRERISLAMRGNQNGKGAHRSPEVRARIAAALKGNRSKLGQKDKPRTLLLKRMGSLATWAQRRGVPVLPSPKPGVSGFVALYGVDRVVFYRPEVP